MWVGGNRRRHALKADLISSLQKRSENELKLFLAIVKALDEWKKE